MPFNGCGPRSSRAMSEPTTRSRTVLEVRISPGPAEAMIRAAMCTAMTRETTVDRDERWLTPGVRGIGAASLLADLGHEAPTALLPSLPTTTLGAPASALGLIEGVADGLAGVARLGGGALADDPGRRRPVAVGGYTSTAVLSGLIGGGWSRPAFREGSVGLSPVQARPWPCRAALRGRTA
jgi:hypothetical protein